MAPATTTQKLGNSIVRERVYQGLTQEQLAKEAGVSRPSLQRLENGKGVQIHTVEAVLEALCLKIVLRRG